MWPQYNRSVKSGGITAVATLLMLGACNRGMETKEAVRQGVIDHLATRANLNVASMQVEVTSVTFRNNEADATVHFRAKGAQGGPGMTMNYTLEKRGRRWVVKSRSEAGGVPHGETGEMPGGLPPGHPPVGGTGSAAPK